MTGLKRVAMIGAFLTLVMIFATANLAAQSDDHYESLFKSFDNCFLFNDKYFFSGAIYPPYHHNQC